MRQGTSPTARRAWPTALFGLALVTFARADAQQPLCGQLEFVYGPAPHAWDGQVSSADAPVRRADDAKRRMENRERFEFHNRPFRALAEAGAVPDPVPITDEAGTVPRSTFDYVPRMSRNYDAGDESGWFPPDPHCAAGPDHVVTIANGRINVFTKDGVSVYQSGLFAFFSPASGLPPFDVKVIYDEDSQRFFALSISTTGRCDAQSYFHLAVSQTSDPSDPNGWWRYTMEDSPDGEAVDYPSLGVGPRALYVGAIYPWCGGHFNCMYVLDKESLINGSPWFGWVFRDIPDETGGSPGVVRPTVTYGAPAGGDAFLLGLGTTVGNTLKATLWRVVTPANFPFEPPTLQRGSVPLPTPAPLVLAEQQGGPGLIVTWNLGAPPLEAVYQNGLIWTSTHYGSDSAPSRTAVRYYGFHVAGWPTVVLARVGTFWDGTSYYYWPGIAANHHGDVAMVFARSSDAEFAGAGWTVLPADEGGLYPSQYLAQGEAYYGDPVNDPFHGVCEGGANGGSDCDTRNGNADCPGGTCDYTPVEHRWGDYAGAAVDPVSHGFWLLHEYAVARPDGTGTWRLRLGHIPRAVFVDGTYGGTEAGTRVRPWNSVSEGHASALPGNDLVIRTGTYAESVILNKPVTIIPDGGGVTIVGQ